MTENNSWHKGAHTVCSGGEGYLCWHPIGTITKKNVIKKWLSKAKYCSNQMIFVTCAKYNSKHFTIRCTPVVFSACEPFDLIWTILWFAWIIFVCCQHGHQKDSIHRCRRSNWSTISLKGLILLSPPRPRLLIDGRIDECFDKNDWVLIDSALFSVL